MPFKYNPFTHKLDIVEDQGGSTGFLTSLTGNDGMVVTGDSSGNINFVGTGPITVTKTGAHTETISYTGGFSPNKTIQEFDDFNSNPSNGGNLGWINGSPASGATFYQYISSSGNPGQWIMTPSVAGVGIWSGISLNSGDASANSTGCFTLGEGSISLNWVCNLSTLSNITNRYLSTIGLTDICLSTSYPYILNGCYFSYEDDLSSGNWQINCMNNNTVSTFDSGIAATTNFFNLGIEINSNGSSVHFYINGAETANSPITGANIPSVQISPFWGVLPGSGAAPTQIVDLFYYTQILNTAR